MKTIKIFLASSSELESDRKEFEIFINRKNKEYVKDSIFLELLLWEDFIDAISVTRLQDEYNKAVKGCDIFVSLFHTKVGKYTEEEFLKALENFKARGKPLIYTYFKDEAVNISKIPPNIVSLINFKQKLSDLGHFYINYADINDLKNKFSDQLIKVLPQLTGISQSNIEQPSDNKNQNVTNEAQHSDGSSATRNTALDNPVGLLITGVIKGWLETKDQWPSLKLLFLVPILLTFLVIVFPVRGIHWHARFSHYAYKALEEFENAKNKEKKLEQAKALMSAMKLGSGLNALSGFGKESIVYVLQRIITQLNGSQNQRCKLSSEPLWAVDVNGKQIATGGWTGEVYIWDSEKNLCPKNNQPSWTAKDIITSVSFSPKGEKIAVAAGVRVDILEQSSETEALEKWVSIGHKSFPEDAPEAVLDIDFSSDGKIIAIARGDGGLSLWEFSEYNEKAQKVYHCSKYGNDKPLRSVNFYSKSSSHWLATGGEDGILRLWRLDSWSNCLPNHQLKNGKAKGTQGWIWSVDFHPDKKLLATAGGDGIVRLRNITKLTNFSRGLENQWNSWQKLITTVHFSPGNGQRLATAGWDGTVKLWTVSGKQLAEWNAQSPITSLSFGDDENIATVQLNGTVKVWKMPTLNELKLQGCKWLKSNLKDDTKSETVKQMKARQQRLCKKISIDSTDTGN